MINIDLPTSGERCLGRNAQLKKLRRIWEDGSKNIISIVARGGEGKSTVVRHWLDEMAVANFGGAKRVFARSFGSYGTCDRPASAENVIDEALRFFGEQNPERLSPQERGVKLARLVGEDRNLLILDGVESWQHSPGEMAGEIKDPSLESLLKTLLFRNLGLCIVTTREEIRVLQGSVQHENVLLPRLTKTAARRWLKILGVVGDQQEIDRAIEENEGHALAITLLGTYLVNRFDGEIANIERVTCPPGMNGDPIMRSTELLKGRERESQQARRMIGSYQKWFEDEPDQVNRAALVILRFLGLFNRQPEPECIAALRAEPIPGLSEVLFEGDDVQGTWEDAILRLESTRLVERCGHDWNHLDCHPLIREYFAEQLSAALPSMIQPDNRDNGGTVNEYAAAGREAHRRLYEHLKKAAPEQPEDLKNMMPLFHAVVHGSKARLDDDAFVDVFIARIQRHQLRFATTQLGAFGLSLYVLRQFLEKPNDPNSARLSQENCGTFFSTIGFVLKALGRSRESMTFLSEALKSFLSSQQWHEAVVAASNLCETYRGMSDFASAINVASQGVAVSQQVGDIPLVTQLAALLANCLQHIGKAAAAEALFIRAERLQSDHDAALPQLYSVPGFLYCELLFDKVQHELCQTRRDRDLVLAKQRCVGIQKRAHAALGLADVGGATGLSSALAQLTLGKSLLLLVVIDHLQGRPRDEMRTDLKRAGDYIDVSMKALETLNRKDYVPRAKLVKAEWLRQVGQFGGAMAEATDALRLSKSASMTQYSVDALLEQTRIHLAKSCFVSGSRPDVAYSHQLSVQSPKLNERGQSDRRSSHIVGNFEGGHMYQIEAVIRHYKLEDLKNSLVRIGVGGMYVEECRGFGSQRGHKETYRGAEYVVDFRPKVKVTVVVPGVLLGETMEKILESVRTGQIGDGKLFITSIESAVRIRTGETGAAALDSNWHWNTHLTTENDPARETSIVWDKEADVYVGRARTTFAEAQKLLQTTEQRFENCLAETGLDTLQELPEFPTEGEVIGYYRRTGEFMELAAEIESLSAGA